MLKDMAVPDIGAEIVAKPRDNSGYLAGVGPDDIFEPAFVRSGRQGRSCKDQFTRSIEPLDIIGLFDLLLLLQTSHD